MYPLVEQYEPRMHTKRSPVRRSVSWCFWEHEITCVCTGAGTKSCAHGYSLQIAELTVGAHDPGGIALDPLAQTAEMVPLVCLLASGAAIDVNVGCYAHKGCLPS